MELRVDQKQQLPLFLVPNDGQEVSERGGSNYAILKNGSFPYNSRRRASGSTWCGQELKAPVDFFRIIIYRR
jgi:hypothetical protein